MSDNWQNKIFNHEETPPKGAWENIARMLDESDDKKAVVVPINKKSKKVIYWRIAAAACIVAVLATTAIWLNADRKITTTTPTASNTVAKETSEQNPLVASNDSQSNNVVSKNNNTSTIVTPVKKKVTITNNTTGPVEYVMVENTKPLAPDPTLNKTEKLTNTSGDIPNDIALMSPPNSYVSFIGPNGQEVKVSSKFSNLLGYMDGKDPEAEEYLDKIINESNFWRGKFKNWRAKMINNNLAPSPSNFMDIIELSKLLSEDK